MHTLLRRGALALALVPAGATTAAAATPEDVPTTITQPDLYYLDHWDVSPPLREMPPIAPESLGRRRQAGELNERPLGPPAPAPPGWTDPLEQASRAPAPEVGVTAGLSFDGVGVGLAGYSPFYIPPDTNGAVGISQYVQWVNVDFAVFNKATGALTYGPAAGRTLWQGFGGACETYNDGDPIASYDKLAHRWVMTQFATPTGGPYYQCVAVSTSSDATGSYRRFAYSFSAVNDYPKLGVWSDGYYVTFNMFTPSGSNWFFNGARVCALDRANMLSPSATPGAIQCFQLSSAYFGLLPADVDGTTAPPAGAPNYMLNFGTNALRLWKFKVNWATPASTTLTGPTSIAVASFASANSVPQPGTSQTLATLSDRLMYRLAYRNFGTYESLLVNHSVKPSSSAAAIRWYELRSPNGTPTVYQQGTFAPDSTARWMGSIAEDRLANVAVGYSASSSSTFPSIRYTGRVAGDALGTLQTENTLIAGGGSQLPVTCTNGPCGHRWGDYSSMTVDPVDDCTFWYTTEYLKSNGSFNWSTRIGSFRFPACTPDFSLSCVPSSLSIQQSRSDALVCNVHPLWGYSSPTSLSCTNLPSGVTCSPNPASVTPSGGDGVSVVTISVAATAATGTSTFQVQATGGGKTHTFPVPLSVTSPPQFELTCTPDTLSVEQGNTRSTTCSLACGLAFAPPSPPGEASGPPQPTCNIDLSCSGLPAGASCSFNPNPISAAVNGSANSTLSVSVSAGVPLGSYAFSVQGSNGVFSHSANPMTLQVVAAPAPNFSVSCSPSSLTVAAGANQTAGCTVATQNWSGGAVSMSCTGLPAGASCAFAPNPVSPPGYGSAASTLTLSVAVGTAPGTYAFQVQGTAGATARTFGMTLTVPAPSFTLACNPTSLAIPQGSSGTTNCTVTSAGGFSAPVTLACAKLPSGVTCGFSANPVTPPPNGSVSSVVTFNVDQAAPTGGSAPQVRGTSGTLSALQTLSLTVQPGLP